jgi:2-(1,2-epoxy-1,2-dihydrophenyl)acetyl-CoA isomerase
MPVTKHIRVERNGAIGLITLDRRQRFNSLDVETARDFRQAGLRCARDDSLRVVVIRGTDGVFCSGADLKQIRSGDGDGELSYLRTEGNGGAVTPGSYGERFSQILEYLHSAISEIRRAPKPFIAAVDGAAAAGGFGLAMACDLVFASERSVFEWAYGKTGLTGAESSTFLLPRLIGLRRCLELVFLNPRLDAETALQMGLVNAVFPDPCLEPEVLAVAERLARGPKRAYAISKGLLNRAAGMERIDYHLDEELEHLRRVADGPEFAEGIDAFLARRPADFRGL